MKKNLPVKYGLLPVLDFDNVIGNLCVKNVRVVGYVVSKCYLVSEHTEYLEDGNVKTNYDVIFPYKEIYYNNKIQAIENKDDEYYLSYTEQVFDNIKEAKEACYKENSKLFSKENKDIDDYNARLETIERDVKVFIKTN